MKGLTPKWDSAIATPAHRTMMRNKDKWVNALLVLLVASLLAICIRSVVNEVQSQNKQQEQRDAREQ